MAKRWILGGQYVCGKRWKKTGEGWMIRQVKLLNSFWSAICAKNLGMTAWMNEELLW